MTLAYQPLTPAWEELVSAKRIVPRRVEQQMEIALQASWKNKISLVPLRESRLSFHISHIKTRIFLSHLPLLWVESLKETPLSLSVSFVWVTVWGYCEITANSQFSPFLNSTDLNLAQKMAHAYWFASKIPEKRREICPEIWSHTVKSHIWVAVTPFFEIKGKVSPCFSVWLESLFENAKSEMKPNVSDPSCEWKK